MTNLRALREIARPTTANKSAEGLAHLVVFKPDATAPQTFIVGVVVQSADLAKCQFRVLQDAQKFKTIYGHRIVLDDIHWALQELEERIAQAAATRTPVSEWRLGSPNFRLEAGRYTSGQSLDAMVSRAFEHAVVMAKSQHESRQFEPISTASVRSKVAEHLKLLAGICYEQFAVEGVPYEHQGFKGQYDVTHSYEGRVGTVVSGWASSSQTLRTTLWHANSEVTTCAKATKGEAGIFLLFPDVRGGIQEEAWRSMNTFLDQELHKLENAGLRVVTLPTTEGLAGEIWSWYKPSLDLVNH